ncbi:MAG: cytidylate kinase-like family protein [Clostridia bacterium]|nr:cytidylate kinase-like family protein [Oscillospiraceae bacterium]MBR4892458.1 cytidylate kinase-like family protein [Clostridia bacterium]
MSNLVITIGRQFGSGGREIGIKLADKLGIKCYDKEIIKRASTDSGICEKFFENADEKPINSFLYSTVAYGFPTYSVPVNIDNALSNDKMFSHQAEAIKKISEENASVFIGRCADDILKENEKLVTIFIYGNKEDRAKRISQKYNISEKEALEMIKKIDKSRSSYYEFFANKRWGDVNNYMLCINSSVGIDKTVNSIYNYIMELNYGI